MRNVNNTQLINNHIANNGWGLSIFNSKNCFINENTIVNNTVGVIHSWSFDNYFSANTISYSSTGVNITTKHYSAFTGNTISYNTIGFRAPRRTYEKLTLLADNNFHDNQNDIILKLNIQNSKILKSRYVLDYFTITLGVVDQNIFDKPADGGDKTSDVEIRILGSPMIILTNNQYAYEKRGIYGEIIYHNTDWFEFNFSTYYKSSTCEYNSFIEDVDFQGPGTYPFWLGGSPINDYLGYGLCSFKVIVDGINEHNDLYLEKTAWGISLEKYAILSIL